MRRLFLKAYFSLRPKFPWALRMALRRPLAKRSRRRFSASWPINELASREPDCWIGWPDGKKFAFVLTHDVEGWKGVDRCRKLAAMEMRLGFRSSFNFVPEGKYDTPKSLRDFLTARGFEVAVHDLRHDGKLFRSEKNFRREAQTINQYLAEWGATGFRSGFMLHNFDWLRELNILYDASGFDTDPFEPQPDGTNTIFPFWVGRNDGSGYVELPYTLPQDSTVFLLLRESGIETWIRKLDWVASHGGLAMVTIHPDYVSFDGVRHSSEYEVRIYQEFLEYVASRYAQEAWFALPKDVAAYINQGRRRFVCPDSYLPYASSGNGSRPNQVDSGTPVDLSAPHAPPPPRLVDSDDWFLQGKRMAMVMFSYYPSDPRPRRAAEAFASKGMKLDLICLAEKAEDPRQEVLNGINVLRIPISRRRGSIFRYAFEYGAFLLASAAILAVRSLTRGYDFVYVHNMPDILVLSGLVPKMCGAKVILDLHDPMPELMTTIFGFGSDALPVRFLKWLEAWSISFSDAVVTVNRTFADLFISRSCPSQKMTIVMNTPDARIFGLRPPCAPSTEDNKQHERFVIMYHGSMVERNGVDLAIEAFARVRKSVPGAELRLYGEHTAFLDHVTNSVRDMDLRDAIHYLGPKSLEDLVPAIDECNVGIIPNHRSVFTEINTPTRIFEYLARGKPVIAPRSTGVCDYFVDNSLIFFELGDAEDLAQRIEYVSSHPDEVRNVVRRGQDVYLAHAWVTERQRLTALVASLLREEVVSVESSRQKFPSGQIPTVGTS